MFVFILEIFFHGLVFSFFLFFPPRELLKKALKTTLVLLSFLFRGNKKKKEDEEELNEKLNRLFSFVDVARMSLKKKKKKGEGG